MHAIILPDNAASRAGARRLGMRVVGDLDDPHGVHEVWSTALRGNPPPPDSV